MPCAAFLSLFSLPAWQLQSQTTHQKNHNLQTQPRSPAATLSPLQGDSAPVAPSCSSRCHHSLLSAQGGGSLPFEAGKRLGIFGAEGLSCCLVGIFSPFLLHWQWSSTGPCAGQDSHSLGQRDKKSWIRCGSKILGRSCKG